MSNIDDYINNVPRKVKPKRKKIGDSTWNVLTGLMIFMTVGAIIIFMNLLKNPASSVNPFVPSTIIPPPQTATWTPLALPPTWTPTVTVPPTSTFTPRPTYTLEPSATPYRVKSPTPNFSPTPELSATRTPKPTGAPFTPTVSYNDSTTFRPDASCSSMYVAGQALDSNNTPVRGLIVKLGGNVPGKSFLTDRFTTLTGINKVYGESGFEFDLKIKPVNSLKTMWIQLFDLSGTPISTQFKFDTFSDCKKNLAFIRFQQK